MYATSEIRFSLVRFQYKADIHCYLITDFFSVRGELKFRDPQFDMQSKFSKTEVIINGQPFEINNDVFDSKVNINGITFGLGLVVHFL